MTLKIIFMGTQEFSITSLRLLNSNYDILTVGDTISLPYNNNILKFDIIECLPEDSICIKNTDLEVEVASGSTQASIT